MAAPEPASAEAPPLSDTAVAVAAARAGADVVRRMAGASLSRVDKGGGDFATDADIAAERAILRVLRAHRPGDAVLGEEGGRQGAAESERQWLVDPLCGTLNYAAGTGPAAVNVALRGGPAAVADPMDGDLYFTDGTGAWSHADGRDSRLSPTAESRLVDVNLDPPFPGAPRFSVLGMLGHPDFRALFRPRVVSTSLALAWVAAGKRAAYVTDGEDFASSVHFAAGIALCRAAGATVTALDGGPVGVGGLGLVAAADAEAHRLLLSIIGDRP
ncbi:inositol monophosphatase family protein [Salininema proteolyticum]|uniref:Inositol monophosphatase family protein n=1 Tax=Salininema proteolyticum TaxID=1607685 RepID=A0ABV8TYB1_9ACTN